MAMIRTGKQILNFVKVVAENHFLGRIINGGVYYDGFRPVGSTFEDVVIRLVSGEVGAIQTGEVEIKIYVPDVPMGDNLNVVEDWERCKVMERFAQDLVDFINTLDDFYFEQKEIIRTEKSENTKEHFVIMKLNYKITNY